MRTFMVGYDLDKPDQDYPALINALKAYGTWWHNLDSTWFIKANATAAQVRDTLRQHIGTSDKLLVVEVTDDGWASLGFDNDANQWLKEQLPAA